MEMVRAMWSRTRSNESGIALILVLVLALLVSLISATLVALAMGEYQTSGTAASSRQAFQITEAAVEKGIFELKRDPQWDDALGATRNLTGPGVWQPLWDGAANVTNQDFPSSAPVGRITLELCRYDTGTFCPGVINPVEPACFTSTCVWMRATGRAGGASRRIEVLLGKILPGVDFTAYSASPVNIGAGGGGNGDFRLHGSLYIASCIDPDGAGPQPCIGLSMQGNGMILNDVPFIGDTSPPYHNRVYVRGNITGQGTSWQIGQNTQLMWGVHAFGWDPSIDSQIDAYQKDYSVPYVPFPDPSAVCAGTSPKPCLINRVYLPAGDPDRIVPSNARFAYVCPNSGGCTAAQWQSVDLMNPAPVLTLSSSNPTRTKVLIPDRDPATGLPVINCTNGAQTATCNATNGALTDVSGANNFSLVFNGFLGSGSTNLYAQRDAFIHTRAHLRFDGTIIYTGFTTFLVENSDDVGASSPAVDIRGSFAPACRASQGTGCTQTFGLASGGAPAGNTFAFAVGPSNPATTGGAGYIRGSGIELNLVLFAHGTIKNDNPQDWYGIFIAQLLDWDNNPSIFPVNSLRANLPPGISNASQPPFGVGAFRWREVF